MADEAGSIGAAINSHSAAGTALDMISVQGLKRGSAAAGTVTRAW